MRNILSFYFCLKFFYSCWTMYFLNFVWTKKNRKNIIKTHQIYSNMELFYLWVNVRFILEIGKIFFSLNCTTREILIISMGYWGFHGYLGEFWSEFVEVRHFLVFGWLIGWATIFWLKRAVKEKDILPLSFLLFPSNIRYIFFSHSHNQLLSIFLSLIPSKSEHFYLLLTLSEFQYFFSFAPSQFRYFLSHSRYQSLNIFVSLKNHLSISFSLTPSTSKP